MRHRKHKRKFGRTSAPRTAMLRDLATSFFLTGKIRTTEAKAKEIRRVTERLITRSRTDTLANRRILLHYLYTEAAVKKAFSDIGPKMKGRNGGYTRIVKLGHRQGDGAPMVQLELVA